MTIRERLYQLQDAKYADFQCNLTPGIDRDKFIGVRLPELKKLAKQLYKDHNEEVSAFMQELPHPYYDEDMLHGLLIAEIKDYETCVEALEAFLPYVNNWAVCDTMSPKIFKKHKPELLCKAQEWMRSDATYTIRFGMKMIMSYFLDDDFKKEYLVFPASIRSDEYYVKMMQAWFFATALAKQWDATIGYVENHMLDDWTHNKTIQKAIESYRITDEQKIYLKTLRISVKRNIRK